MSILSKIDGVFKDFLSEVEKIVDLKCAILSGSAVLGDFKEGNGDLDFMMLTKKALTDTECDKLFELHDKYRLQSVDNMFSRLEGCYYPFEMIERPIKSRAKGCYIGTSRKGWKRTDSFVNSLMDLKIIKLHGRFYKGEELRPKIYEPSEVELTKEIFQKINEAIKQYPDLKNSIGWLVSVVHLCLRSQFFIETGKIASKTASVTWFLEKTPGNKWKEALLFCRDARYPYPKASEEQIAAISKAAFELLKLIK